MKGALDRKVESQKVVKQIAKKVADQKEILKNLQEMYTHVQSMKTRRRRADTILRQADKMVDEIIENSNWLMHLFLFNVRKQLIQVNKLLGMK